MILQILRDILSRLQAAEISFVTFKAPPLTDPYLAPKQRPGKFPTLSFF